MHFVAMFAAKVGDAVGVGVVNNDGGGDGGGSSTVYCRLVQ